MKDPKKRTAAKPAAPSMGRASKGVGDGAKKAMDMSDRLANQAFAAGLKTEGGAVKSTGYAYGTKKTPGNSTPRARAADAAVGSYKPLAKKGK
jgi:hypothetical protein